MYLYCIDIYLYRPHLYSVKIWIGLSPLEKGKAVICVSLETIHFPKEQYFVLLLRFLSNTISYPNHIFPKSSGGGVQATILKMKNWIDIYSVLVIQINLAYDQPNWVLASGLFADAGVLLFQQPGLASRSTYP